MSHRRLSLTPPLPRAARLGAVLLVAASAAGCREQPRPWEGQSGPAVVLSAPPPRVARPPSGLLLGAGEGDGDAGSAVDPDLPPLPVRVGGPWVRCYGNFRLTGEPLKDLTRLGLLCGPENGMRRATPKPIEGHVKEGGPGVEEKLRAFRGACYRVFAVGGPGIINLDVTVRSSRGATIATDGGEDAWPIVQPDRPFCALEDDLISVEISARRGEGQFAAEVWVLKTYQTPKEEDLYEDIDASDAR